MTRHGAGEQRRWGRRAAALSPNVFANPHQLRGLKPASGSLYNIKTKGVVGAMIGGRRGREGGARCSACRAGKVCRNPLPIPSREVFPGELNNPVGVSSPRHSHRAGLHSPSCRGVQEPALNPAPLERRATLGMPEAGGLWGFFFFFFWGVGVFRSAFFHPVAPLWKRHEFRKPARGECQVRLYRSQAPACFLVLLEPVSDLISLGGSCLINTHLAARRPHSPYIVSLPAPNPAVRCWGGLAPRLLRSSPPSPG